jgi:peroxiredoxin
MRALRVLSSLLAICTSAPLVLICSSAHAEISGQQRAEAAGHDLVGSPAPRMILETIDGNTLDLGSLYGKKAVYLKFWATWCVPCREQMPHFEHAYETEGSDLVVIAVNAGFNDSIEDVRTYRQKLGIKMPIVMDDGTLGAALNLRVTPQHVVIGRDGRIQYVGHLADERLDAAVEAARRAPATKVSAVKGQAGIIGVKGVGAAAAGERAPQFSMTTIDGSLFKLQDPTEARPTALVFLSPWCESYLATSRSTIAANCREVREQVDALAMQNARVRWLGIASGIWATPDELSQYQREHKVKIALTLDESGTLFHTFGVMNVPTVLIIDTRGIIRTRIEGSDAQLPAKLQAVALGK